MSDEFGMPPEHPGEVLAEEYLDPLGVTQHGLAVAIGVPPRRINEIVRGKRGISANTALRPARFFGTSELKSVKNRVHLDVRVPGEERGPLVDRLLELGGREIRVEPGFTVLADPEGNELCLTR